MHILGYFIAGFIGFMIGVVMSCVLLAKKNLEKAQQIENQISDNINLAKATYNSYVNEEIEGNESENNVTMSCKGGEDIV